MTIDPRLPALCRRWLTRHETHVNEVSNGKAGIGAVVGMLVIGQLAVLTGEPLLIAPMGATSVLLFGQPSSPMTQPINIMGGYLIGTIVCTLAFAVFPGVWVASAVGVGVAVVLMRWLRVTHPPAGAIPILGFGGSVQGAHLFSVVFIGCVALIALAVLVHWIPPRRTYPLRPKQG